MVGGIPRAPARGGGANQGGRTEGHRARVQQHQRLLGVGRARPAGERRRAGFRPPGGERLQHALTLESAARQFQRAHPRGGTAHPREQPGVDVRHLVEAPGARAALARLFTFGCPGQHRLGPGGSAQAGHIHRQHRLGRRGDQRQQRVARRGPGRRRRRLGDGGGSGAQAAASATSVRRARPRFT
jgi:hypothetical protein